MDGNNVHRHILFCNTGENNMPKETIINGKNHRWYRLGGLWVSRDGTSAYQPGNTAQTKKKLKNKTDYRGK